MTTRLVVDMNLSPAWIQPLTAAGFSAVHWSTVGDPRAPDREIMAWALANDSIVVTHDLDFTTILALSHARGPSVVLLRTRDTLANQMLHMTIKAISRHEGDLRSGAIVVVESGRSVVRILPL